MYPRCPLGCRSSSAVWGWQQRVLPDGVTAGHRLRFCAPSLPFPFLPARLVSSLLLVSKVRATFAPAVESSVFVHLGPGCSGSYPAPVTQIRFFFWLLKKKSLPKTESRIPVDEFSIYSCDFLFEYYIFKVQEIGSQQKRVI